MSDVTVLRTNAIQRNASVGAQPPHGAVKTGELPLVHMKQPAAGPQIQEGQQKPVQIMAPNSKGAFATGGLPMVKVKMTDGKPKPEDGVDERVVIRDSKHGAVSAGALPMIQVKMTDGKPQVQTLPNVQGGPPQIPSAPPALSAPRGAQGYTAHQGYAVRPAGPVTNQSRVTRVAAPVAQLAQVSLPPVPVLSTDQLMFCRHVVDKYLGELNAAAAATDTDGAPSVESGESVEPIKSDLVEFAEAMIETIDDVLVATAVHAEAARLATAAATAAAAAAPVAASPAALTIGAPTATSIAPAPTVAYNAGRVGGRSYVAGGARSQRNSGMAPRRTGRSSLPPVIVKMEGQQAVVQNRAEVEQAKAAAAAAAEAAAAAAAIPADDTIRVLGEQNINLSAENEALRRELEEARANKATATPIEVTPADGDAQG